MFCCLTRYVTEYITYLNGVWWCDQVNDRVRYVTEYITYLNGVLWCGQVNNTMRYVRYVLPLVYYM